MSDKSDRKCSIFITTTDDKDKLKIELSRIVNILKHQIEENENNTNYVLDYQNLIDLFNQGICVCQKIIVNGDD